MSIKNLLFILVFAATAFSQDVLTNKDITAMLDGGLSEPVIVAKIKNSPTKFDTDTPALIALANAKVPQTVIQAMVDKREAIKPPKPVTEPFIPIGLLDKKAQKERRKQTIQLDIGNNAKTVSQLLVRSFQGEQWTVESSSDSSLTFAKEQTGFAASLMKGMNKATAVLYKVTISISEIDGVSRVVANIWLDMPNAFGASRRSSLDKDANWRIPVENILSWVKTTAEK